MDPVIMSVAEKDPMSNKEFIIDRDSYVFDTQITISTISVSRANLSDNVGKHIAFLEIVQATIVPYDVVVAFPFLEFIGWCENKYS